MTFCVWTAPGLIETILHQQKQVSEEILARAKGICAKKNVSRMSSFSCRCSYFITQKDIKSGAVML